MSILGLFKKKTAPTTGTTPTPTPAPAPTIFVDNGDPNLNDSEITKTNAPIMNISINTASPIDEAYKFLCFNKESDGENDASKNPSIDNMNKHLQIIAQGIELVFSQVENIYTIRIAECQTKIKQFMELGYPNSVIEWETKLGINKEQYAKLTELKRIYLVDKEQPIVAIETYKQGFINYVTNNANQFGGNSL